MGDKDGERGSSDRRRAESKRRQQGAGAGSGGGEGGGEAGREQEPKEPGVRLRSEEGRAGGGGAGGERQETREDGKYEHIVSHEVKETSLPCQVVLC